jgi:hypothetical protein
MTEEFERIEAATVAVRVIESRGESALVEWVAEDGALKRAYVPTAHGFYDADDLEAGVPYGDPWEDLVDDVVVMGQDVAAALRRGGFWTAEDVERDPRRAQGVVNRLVAPNVAVMAKAAKDAR